MRIQPHRRRSLRSTTHESCAHHHHEVKPSGPHVPEAIPDVAHAALEVYLDHGHAGPAAGVVSGAVSVLSAVRGVQSFRHGGLEHQFEGVGNLALATASGLTAFEMFKGHDHSHGHGIGVVGALEMVHGAAEIATGSIGLKRGSTSKAEGLVRIAKGSSVIAAQLFPGIAPACHLVHLGTAIAGAALNPTH